MVAADMAAGAEAGAFSSSPDPGSVPRECTICSVSFESERAQLEHDISLQHHQKLDKAGGGGSVSHHCPLCKQTTPNFIAFVEHISSESHRRKLQENRRITSAPSLDRPLQGSSVNWSTGKKEIFGHSMDVLKQSTHRRSSLTKPLPFPTTKTPKGKESKGPFRKKGKGADPHQATAPQSTGTPAPSSGSMLPAKGAEKIRKIMHGAAATVGARPSQKMGELPSFLPLDSSLSITKPSSPPSGDDGAKMPSITAQSLSKGAVLKHREALKKRKKPHHHSPGKKLHSSSGSGGFVHHRLGKKGHRPFSPIPAAEQLQRMKLKRDAVTSSSKQSHIPAAQPSSAVTSQAPSLSSSTAKRLSPVDPPLSTTRRLPPVDLPPSAPCPPNYRFPSPVIPPPRPFIPPQHLMHPHVTMSSLPPPLIPPPPPLSTHLFHSSAPAPPYLPFPQQHMFHSVPPQPPAGIRPIYNIQPPPPGSQVILPHAARHRGDASTVTSLPHSQSSDITRPSDTSSPLSGSSDYDQKDMDISESSESETVPSAPQLPLPAVVPQPPDLPPVVPSAPPPPDLPLVIPSAPQHPSLPTEISSASQPSPVLPKELPGSPRSSDLPTTKVSNLETVPSVSPSSGLSLLSSPSRPTSLFSPNVTQTLSQASSSTHLSTTTSMIVSPAITSASVIVSPSITSVSVSPVITSASTILPPVITSSAPTHAVNSPVIKSSAGSTKTPLSPSGKAKRPNSPLLSSRKASPPPLKKARRSLSYSEGTDNPPIPAPSPKVPSPEAMSPQDQCQFLHKSGNRCLQPSHNDSRLCEVHLAISLALKEQLGLSPGGSSRRKTQPAHHFKRDDISYDQTTQQSSAPMDAPGGDSSAGGGGSVNTSNSADSSSPSGSSLNGGDSDGGASNGGQGAAGGDGDKGNDDKNTGKSPRGGMQDRLAELNKQEDEIQAELVQTYEQLTQVTREREQLEERLQLLLQQEQQLTDRQQSLSEHYRSVLEQKQNIVLSCFISPPNSTIKTEVKPIISLPLASTSSSIISSTTAAASHSTANITTSQSSISTAETPMETSSDPSACFSPPLSVPIKTKSKTQKKFTPKRLQLTPKKPIQSLKPSSVIPSSSHTPPVAGDHPVITPSSRPSNTPQTIEALRNSPTTIRRQSGSSTDTGSSTTATSKTGSNTDAAMLKTGSNTATTIPTTGSAAVPKTGSNTVAAPKTGSNIAVVSKTGSSTAVVPNTCSNITVATPMILFAVVPKTGSNSTTLLTGSNTTATPKTSSNTAAMPKTGSSTTAVPKTVSNTTATPKTSSNTAAISKTGSSTTAVPKTGSTPVLKSSSCTTTPSAVVSTSTVQSTTIQSTTLSTNTSTTPLATAAVKTEIKVEATNLPPRQEVAAGGSQGTSAGSSSALTAPAPAAVPPQFEPHTQSVLALKVYSDLLFSCSIDKSIRSYNIKTGKRVKTFDGHNKTVTCLEVYHSVHSGNSYVLSGSSDRTIQMHSIRSGRLVAMFKCTTRVMYLAVCSKLLFVAQNNGSTAIINLEDKKLVGRQECHNKTHAISCIATTRTQLFTAAFDNLIKCWDIKTLVDNAVMEQPNELKLVHTISSFSKTVLCLKVQDSLLFCGSADHSVQVYDLKSWVCLHRITCHRNTVSGLHIMGKLLITASFDRYVRCFDIERMELVQVYGGHPDMIFSVTADRNVIYTGARDGSVQAIPVNLNVFYSCKWSNCQLRFGVADHLVTHVLEDHCKDIVSSPVSCLWSKCSSTAYYDKASLLKTHLTSTHIEPNQ